eukprot:CAMPEP_0177530126 /NCGR_PEP_ID=MMETSP0369-20130122/53213_1 /TAXON_ID=447022 ORGANISM="Scrippsiella hangoei-like, Strain SHHI-4" /NCGR_SAMPLE_ID=MMETSP0369 /ASSEMBLY_ACC=CAM_ASM_000364 /LENGTH=50 /DNA_ID=CAMNT_0019010921 /DNA_START=10 /DNA_END=159 /DNA_ORIENTATION=-
MKTTIGGLLRDDNGATLTTTSHPISHAVVRQENRMSTGLEVGASSDISIL